MTRKNPSPLFGAGLAPGKRINLVDDHMPRLRFA